MKSNVDRIQSMQYVHDDDAPILKFNSVDKGIDEDDNRDINNKNSTIFMYNSDEDIYRLKSKKSRVLDKKTHLELIKEENHHEENHQVEKHEEENNDPDNMSKCSCHGQTVPGGNIIFANLRNIEHKEKKLTPLYLIMLSYLAFCFVELFFGYYSNSLIIMADAVHYFAEGSCFAIFILSLYVSKKQATNNMSFGFHRGEIIGILVRVTFMFGFSIWLLYTIFLNIMNPSYVNGFVIIIIGIISTLINLIMGLVLIFIGISNIISFSEKQINCQHQHSNDDLNCNSTRETFTKVIFLSIQSCIIIIAGLFVYFLPSLSYIDPICTLMLTGILLKNAYVHMTGAITILMEGSPLEFDIDKLHQELNNIEGVNRVEQIHVWSLSIGKLSMSCHIFTEDPQKCLVKAREKLKKEYNITHSTIQVEFEKKDKNKNE